MPEEPEEPAAAEPDLAPLEPELPPPEPEEEEPEAAGELPEEAGEEPEEENFDDQALFPEDTTLELAPDEEESIFSDEIPEDPHEDEDSFLDLEGGLEPDPEIPPEEEPAAVGEPMAADEPAEPALETEDTPGEEQLIDGETISEEDLISQEEPLSGEEPAFEEELLSEEETIPEEETALEKEGAFEKEPVPGEEAAEDFLAAGDSSEPKEDRPLNTEGIAGLLNHLKKLAHELPNKDMELFLNSDVRLSLEFLIDVLKGRKGLYKDISERMGKNQKAAEKGDTAGTPPPAEVAGTLTYLEQLASSLPDKELSAAITRKTDAVIAVIKQGGEIKAPPKKG
jgi:hypothetical protein